MTERSYGYKYAELGDQYRSAADIAKLMRRDIKQAIADGLLPAEPAYRVRVENYSGGRSIDITVEDFPNAWQECGGYQHGAHTAGAGRTLCPDYFCAAKLALLGEDKPGAQSHNVLSADAEAARITLERIHGAYNHNGSDAMTDYFDVNYYGQVSFESAGAAERRRRDAATQAAKRKALDELAAAATKRVVVYGGRGRRQTVHDAVELDNGRVQLVCGAIPRAALLGNGAGRELTCSRCAKREAKATGAPVRARVYKHTSTYTRWSRWIVEITRGAAKLETHVFETHAEALNKAAEALTRLGGAK